MSDHAHTRVRRAAAVAMTVVAAATVVTATARAGEPRGQLGVTLSNFVHGGGFRHWTLTCDPDGGSHPAPRQACDRIRAVDGDLERLSSRPGICSRVYDPWHVDITGTWRGQDKNFREDYPNADCMARAAGAVVPNPRR